MELGPLRPSPDMPVGAHAPASHDHIPARKEIIEAVKAVNASGMLGQDSELTFVLDRHTGQPLLRIIDRETGEIIKQIPAEHLMRLARELRLEKSLGYSG